MRKRIVATVVVVPLAGVIALPGAALAATGGTTIHVDDMSPFCTDTGAAAGSAATPFCTIQAAADAATAGDTVQIFGGAANAVFYTGNVTISSSGTASAPITFEAVGPDVIVDGTSPASPAAVTVDGARDVDLVGFAVANLDVEKSTNVSISRSNIDGLTVGSGSSGVSVQRNDLASVTVGPGASDTVLAVNLFQTETLTGGITVSGATGTDITNNTIEMQTDTGAKVAGISVTDAASGTSIENNVLWGNSAGVAELAVDASSASGTSEKYNLLCSDGGANVAYSWAGETYSTVAAFQAASGQGTADILTDFDTNTADDLLTSQNPAVASADSAAPGLPSTDFYGNAWTDDTAVTATGAGPQDYYDRGAVNFEEYTGATVDTTVDGQDVFANVNLRGLPIGNPATISVDWGDGKSADVLGSSNAQTMFTDFTRNFSSHQYQSAGTYTITATVTDGSGTRTFTSQVTTAGSTYIPVAPTRVLDTRSGLGTTSAGAVAGGHSVAFNVTNGVAGAPAASTISAVVLNVTVTQPGGNGFVTAYPDGVSVPNSSNVNYAAGQTVPNLTTVMVGQDGDVDLYTTAKTQLIADVEGYYVTSPSDSGYNPISPVRLLDTRDGTGAAAQAVGPGKTVSLQVAGKGGIPATGVVAAAMNVTVTQPSSNGLITVYPQGGTTPNTSNVNYGKGQTVANMAVVKLGTGGQVEFTNTSNGTVQVIADVAGYYTSTGGDAFIPMTPWRALDTRNGTGQESSLNYPVTPDSNAAWFFGDEFAGTGYWSGDADPAALVMNVTITQPTANGVMIAYPGPNLPTASNSDFAAGQTLPAMVMVACDPETGQPSLYNQSKGTTQMIADVFGYFS